ncbi:MULTISPECIES: hypothetical protein [Hyphomonas]|uniref:hypothetical protein n=1 Tax=Hyphomonas TaxID=85 RepID=UPI002352935A|nr:MULTISPECIES: hypothetical protein [Hyphomonas]
MSYAFQHAFLETLPLFCLPLRPIWRPSEVIVPETLSSEKERTNKIARTTKAKLMNTDLTTSTRTDADEIRAPEVKDITRAIIAGEAVQMPVNRPRILARRMARWSRRATHA